ncbi:hypothetical protein [Saccharomonospora sp. CUA-673]|uniref:hypothetical protein n=1 Tax=Saccharomonospora sp. CUA-673 TaxID=1904969 RepID=UPI002101C42D|nr:hypothetical protein [Saccharomonospora sp. CUA-673]
MSTTNVSANARPAATVWPVLQARDAGALIDFLVDTVGFLRTAVYADGDQVAHAQLDWPEGGGVMLGSYQPAHDWSREPGTAGMYVVTATPTRCTSDCARRAWTWCVMSRTRSTAIVS